MKGLTQEDLCRQLEYLYEHLVGIGVEYIVCFAGAHDFKHRIPKISDSKIKFRQFNDGDDAIQDIGSIINSGYATAVDIAIWRAAELRAEGKPARAVIRTSGRAQDGDLIHRVLIEVAPYTQDGCEYTYEDPTTLFAKD